MAIGDATYTATVAADGTATVAIESGSRRRNWLLQQVTIDMPTAPAGATARLEKNGSLVTLLIAQGDTAGGDPPVLLRGQQDACTVEWSGCTPGNIGRVLAIYDEQAIR